VPKDITAENFEDEVIRSDIPVLVDFWAPNCSTCIALNSFVDKLAKDLAGKVKVVKVNAMSSRKVCDMADVLSVPTFILYRDGKEEKRLLKDAPLTVDKVQKMAQEAAGA
jgi:thioredoxin 1